MVAERTCGRGVLEKRKRCHAIPPFLGNVSPTLSAIIRSSVLITDRSSGSSIRRQMQNCSSRPSPAHTSAKIRRLVALADEPSRDFCRSSTAFACDQQRLIGKVREASPHLAHLDLGEFGRIESIMSTCKFRQASQIIVSRIQSSRSSCSLRTSPGPFPEPRPVPNSWATGGQDRPEGWLRSVIWSFQRNRVFAARSRRQNSCWT